MRSSRYLEPSDLGGQYGSSSILLLMPNRREIDAVPMVEKVRARVAETLMDDGKSRTLASVSVGIADVSAGATHKEMLGAAEKALNVARRSGGNRVITYGRLTKTARHEVATVGPVRTRDPRDMLFGQIAAEFGYITKSQLQEALTQQSREGEAEPIGCVLLRQGALTPAQIQRVLDRQRRRAYADSLWIRSELELARRVQRQLIPDRLPAVPGVDIAALYHPAGDVGGDFYDVISHGETSLTVAIGDVSGHGLASALGMAMATGVVRTAAAGSLQWRDVLLRLNQMLGQRRLAGMFVTLAWLSVDLAMRRVRVVSAGRPPPLVVTTDGEVWRVDSCGPALGLLPDHHLVEKIEDRELALPETRRVLLYTDGAVSARDTLGQVLGIEGLAAILREARGVDSQGVLNAIMQRISGNPQSSDLEDDVSLVCLTFEEAPVELFPPRVERVEVPA